MEYAAIRHYMEKRYCYAVEKGKFLIRIETKKDDVAEIVLHYQDKYIPVQYLDTRQQAQMNKVASDRFKDYYEVVIDIDVVCLRYQFQITDRQGLVTYYSNYEFYDEVVTDIDRMFDLPQNLREEELFEVPEWARNKVIYQIFPSRYATTEYVEEELWYKTPIDRMDDLKGNLRGIINSIPHLKKLGIDIIYMTPVFASNSSHKYDTIDYYRIDPSFGTTEDLKELVQKAHREGMRVILDGVFNHTSTQFFAFEDVEKNKENSRYKDWYYIKDFPVQGGSRTVKPNYKCFSYFGRMPKLNLSNPETAEYFINVGKYWMEECDIDGWRLDVGDEVVHSFWKKFRQEIRQIKPDALIIGEIWHYAGDFLEGDEWDTVMNYPFYQAVQDFVAKGTITATQFVQQLDFLRGNLHKDVYSVLCNLIDSHDTARFLHTADGNKSKLKLAAALQLLLPGMPMIYYGSEFGMTGGADPDCRRGMVWDKKYQDGNMFDWYCRLTQIRKDIPVLTEGVLIESETDDKNGVVIQTREMDRQQVTVIFHGKDGNVKLSEYTEREELLAEEKFDGILKPYQVAVFMN